MSDKAVILARGLGTRMKKADGAAELTNEQAAAAATGVKAMMPIDRPFLDYVMSGLADAGYGRICLVIGPEHHVVREYYTSLSLRRISIDFAIQDKPLGTANAVAAAEQFAAGDAITVINSDNYYPQEALAGLRSQNGMAVAVFTREAMLAASNIAPERIQAFAVVQTGNGRMRRIIEKPDPATIASLPEPVCVSMNCWRFGPGIFEACRNIKLSKRGEYEVTDAVQYVIDEMHQPFTVLTYEAPVLDMSSRSDVAAISKKLIGSRVEL